MKVVPVQQGLVATALLVSSVLSAAHAADEPKTFLGMKIGAAMSQQRTLPQCAPLNERYPPGHDWRATCHQPVDDSQFLVHNAVLEMGFGAVAQVRLVDGRVEYVALVVPRGQRATMLAALRARYGEQSEVRGGLFRHSRGVDVDGTVNAWTWKHSQLVFREVDSRVDARDEVVFATKAWFEHANQERLGRRADEKTVAEVAAKL